MTEYRTVIDIWNDITKCYSKLGNLLFELDRLAIKRKKTSKK